MERTILFSAGAGILHLNPPYILESVNEWVIFMSQKRNPYFTNDKLRESYI